MSRFERLVVSKVSSLLWRIASWRFGGHPYSPRNYWKAELGGPVLWNWWASRSDSAQENRATMRSVVVPRIGELCKQAGVARGVLLDAGCGAGLLLRRLVLQPHFSDSRPGWPLLNEQAPDGRP